MTDRPALLLVLLLGGIFRLGRIADFLIDELSRFGQDPVADGMRYATRGGKRLRGFLVLEGSRVHGVPPERAICAAASIECLHAYSLVHDDLPAMVDV